MSNLTEYIGRAIERVNDSIVNSGKRFTIGCRIGTQNVGHGITRYYFKIVFVITDEMEFTYKVPGEPRNERTIFEKSETDGNHPVDTDKLAEDTLAFLLTFAIMGHGSPIAGKIQEYDNQVRRKIQGASLKEGSKWLR